MDAGTIGVLVRALMPGMLLGVPQAPQPPMGDSTTVCVVDAATRAPVIGVELRVRATLDSSGARSTDAYVVRTRTACVRIPSGVVHARRVGYRERQVAPDTRVIELTPLAIGMASMDTVRVTASEPATMSPQVGRMSATVSAHTGRERGAATTERLIELLPLTQVRSARGETGVSLRGARREQVVITLDGLPLNDPATGTADVSDLPLASLGSATVTLGADPLASGPGAGGGVIALTSAAQRVLSVRAGSLGQASAEGAWTGQVSGALVHAAAMWRVAENDFAFENTAGATGVTQHERRVNNDETRGALTVGVIGNAWQAAVTASHGERGMVGAANVHAYDADRSITDRLLVRTQFNVRGTQLIAGARRFTLAYRDPARPPLDYDARVQAGELEWRGQHDLPAVRAMLVWRTGGGADAVRASGGLVQDRARAFATTQAVWNRPSSRAEFGLRLDAIEGVGTQPSLALSGEKNIGGGWSLSARAAQAVRAPTLYDLYFSSPQRISVTALRPERITADAEISSHYARQTPFGQTALDLSLVTRRTRDAIVWFPGNFTWSPANVGREQLRGVEARLRATPAWGEWSLWTTLYDPVLLTGNLRIPTPYVARVAGGSQWLVHHRRTSLSLITRSMGRRPYAAGPRDPLYELPAVTLVDVAFTHGLPHTLVPRIESRITWSIDNATDAAWQAVRGFPSPGRTWALAITLRPLIPS